MPRLTREDEAKLTAHGRQAAVVIAAAAVIWVAGNALGTLYSWNLRYLFLLDFAALAAFVWALIVTWRVWNRRRGN